MSSAELSVLRKGQRCLSLPLSQGQIAETCWGLMGGCYFSCLSDRDKNLLLHLDEQTRNLEKHFQEEAGMKV